VEQERVRRLGRTSKRENVVYARDKKRNLRTNGKNNRNKMIKTLEEYKQLMGLNSEDVGSNLAKKRVIVKRLKTKGGRTAKIWAMPEKQLFAVLIKTN
jgi:hypothetical protein